MQSICQHELKMPHDDEEPCCHAYKCFCCGHKYCSDDSMTLCPMTYYDEDKIYFYGVCNFICFNCYDPKSNELRPLCPECLETIIIKKNSRETWTKEIAYQKILRYLRQFGYLNKDFRQLGIFVKMQKKWRKPWKENT